MPMVAPQPVAFCPRPCPGRRSAGSRPSQRSARMRRFSAVAGSRSRAKELLIGPDLAFIPLPGGHPEQPPCHPLSFSGSLAGSVVELPVVVVELEVDLATGGVQLVALGSGDEFLE